MEGIEGCGGFRDDTTRKVHFIVLGALALLIVILLLAIGGWVAL